MDFALGRTPNKECWVLKVVPGTLAMFKEAPGHDAVDGTKNAIVNAEDKGRWTTVKTLRVLQRQHEMGWQKLEEDLSFRVRLLGPFDCCQDLTKNGRRHGYDGRWCGDVEHIIGRRGREFLDEISCNIPDQSRS